MDRPPRIFVSYAHEDEAHREKLGKALRPLERQNLIEIWHDRELLGGEDWDAKIHERVDNSDIFLFLVTMEFLASDYASTKEVARALERHDRGEATAVPIIVSACDWKSSPLARLQAWPRDGRPITSWDNEAEAWADVVGSFRRLLDARRSTGASSALLGKPRGPERPYLEALRERNTWLDVRGMGAQVAERMELQRVYTRLRATAPAGDMESRGAKRGTKDADALLAEREARDRDLCDLLPEHRHAVLIGDPGSGKTTHLRFLAQNLARLCLEPDDAAAREALGLDGERPFPIFIRLTDFAKHLDRAADADLPDDAAEYFYAHLDSIERGQSYDLPAGHLRRRLLDGGCFLLLDGLDEVPGGERRERVARIVEHVVDTGKRAGNRHLITCRTRAYEGRVELSADLATFRLAPFDDEQIKAFVEGWCRALHRVHEDPARAEQADGYRAELLEAIESHPHVRPLTESPLMLTVLSVVHWNRRKLPEQRADLYDAAVEYLLESRREQSQVPTSLRRECLQAVALRMFEDPEGVQRTLGRRPEAADAVAPVLGVDRDRAVAFLEDEELYSGLLVSRTEGEVEFWHLTFQEYLAALELSMDDERWPRIEPHLHDDRWSEVVGLLASCLRRTGGVRAARNFLKKIVATGVDAVSRARAVGLIGRILRDIELYGGDPAEGSGYAEALAATLGIFEQGTEVEETVRIEVGEALGRAGDPRIPVPDFKKANRVSVPGGTFWMGAQSSNPKGPSHDKEAYPDESPVHRVTLSPYRLGRFPVTVQEFRRFVDAGEKGYLCREYWDDDGWAFREKEKLQAPGKWREQLSHPNRPVVHVSWYEASAYATSVRGALPTEAQWEFAARGAAGRKYPWGSETPTDRHASFARRTDAATPVGIYPLGMTPEGIHDLSGNAWEWCRDWRGKYKKVEAIDPTGPDSGAGRVLRGGAFFSAPRYLRGAFRIDDHPEFRYNYVGFRVAWPAARGR